jgi:hypothetical protein
MFFCSFYPTYVEDLRSKIFLVFVKIRRYRLNFMSIGELGEHDNILFALSPYALKYFSCENNFTFNNA